MKKIGLDYTGIMEFLEEGDLQEQKTRAYDAFQRLLNGTAKGNDYLGWLTLPSRITEEELEAVDACAKRLKAETELVVVIGIGGSYLGAKAVIEALSGSFDPASVVFAGHHLSEDYMYELERFLGDKEFGICVISKSGTTTEPAVAFRLLRELLEKKVGKETACRRIVAITDEKRGALRTLADQEGYTTFVIPDDVGGRFSVLTPVGLLPIALAGFDIKALIRGAAEMRQELLDTNGGISLDYAALRNALYNKGYTIEITANYNPKLHYVSEWWKQLFGESEGKEHKGIFPGSVDFSTDLHSMGQYLQDGPRFLFETVLSIEKTKHQVIIPFETQNLDRLNFLSGKTMDEVNKKAEEGTRMAHISGGVPNLRINIPELSVYYLGQLFYFYELACAISGGILDVNAFDQPGVEAYKKNMFALLGKPE